MPTLRRIGDAIVGALLRFGDAVEHALISRQTWTLESVLAGQAVLVGAWIANPWTNTFSSVPDAYTVLGILPEWFVGGVFLAHGIAHASVLRWGTVHQCRRAVLVTALLWLWVLVSFLFTVPLAMSTPVFSSFVAASMWVYVRLHWRYG